MASYSIRWKHSAEKDLRRLEKPAISGIIETVKSLTDNPFPNGSKKLRGTERTHRIRVGDYRIVYSVYSDTLTIEIVGVGHRRDVYRRLA